MTSYDRPTARQCNWTVWSFASIEPTFQINGQLGMLRRYQDKDWFAIKRVTKLALKKRWNGEEQKSDMFPWELFWK